MSETTMPATEAVVATMDEKDPNSYELAFHVLPTVAEGEVATVFEALKDLVTKAGGEIFDEEAPKRFDLAYEIVKHLEGKNRKFKSAYFGWVRFRTDASKIEDIQEEIESRTDILRVLLIKLTRVEEANPFRFHEALEAEAKVENIDATEPVEETAEAEDVSSEEANPKTEEESAEVDEDAVDEALSKEEV